MAVGCTHGFLRDQKISSQVLAFKSVFKPKYSFDLGDLVDTTAFRSGAHGTKDEATPIDPDFLMCERWIQQYEPTHITWGNHDHRLLELSEHPNAKLAWAAKCLWQILEKQAKSVKAKTKLYEPLDQNWFELGGTYWGHGSMYNESAVRDHAEYLGGPVVMAHLHAPQQVQGRTRQWSPSFCVGTLAKIDELKYASRRCATSRWGHGVVWGYVSGNRSQLWLSSCRKGGNLGFPKM